MKGNRGAGQVRIGVNAHLLSSRVGYRRAGIHRYISQIIEHLQPPTGFDVTVYANNQHINNNAVNLVRSRWPTNNRLVRILWEQLAQPVLTSKGGTDLLHSMAFVLPYVRSCPAVVTVYDLSFLHYPDRFPTFQRIYLTTQTRRSCFAAQRIVVISDSTAVDLERFYGISKSKISVVMPGVGTNFRPVKPDEIESFRQQKGLSDPYLLHVGTLQPRKNIPMLVEAIEDLNRPKIQLVLAGGKGWNYSEIFETIEKLDMAGQVKFVGFVPDEELPLWYNAAAATIFPSLYEGFGLPVLEAMACGSPVIAADTSSIPEAAGKAALMFKPTDSAGLIKHMSNVLDDPQLRAKMKENGLDQAKNFTWQTAAQQMISVYNQALQSE